MSKENFHILVIDDNEDILFMLNAMLKHKGYNYVTTRDNAVQIEEFILQIKPHIILMDMHRCIVLWQLDLLISLK